MRFAAFGAMYAAQGVPEGLLYIAVPAWLAERGVSAAAIGAYIGVILVPWSLKLVNGAIMERWTFLAMGRRRPWVLAAQLGLIIALLGLAGIDDPVAALSAVTVLGVAINAGGAFQDVAVDGMAIDVFPRDEQARANGVMWGAKTLGIAASAAVAGWTLNAWGWSAACMATAAIVAAIMTFPLLLRERPGERLLPWSSGGAAPSSAARHIGRWAPILRQLIRATFTVRSGRLIAAIFIALAGYGAFISVLPVATVQTLGWRDTEFTDIAAAANLVGGVFGILIAGPLADKVQPARAAIMALAAMAALHAAAAAVPQAWEMRPVVIGYVLVYQVLFVQMSVAIYALAMRASDRAIAAAHFALFMAFVNLGTSAGAALMGPLRAVGQDVGILVAMAVLAAIALALFATLAPDPQTADSV
ncbi:MAG: MFS transporter [Rhodospirillaceae bacterium]|nr:MFS transporter [Rhodospirillaceae bacterium]